MTGITGFVGSHLAEWALAQGTTVVGSVRWRSKTEHIEHLRNRITLVNSDLRDLSSVRTLLEQARADYIVHLAAQSFVGASWEAPTETLLTNAVSQMNLFEAIRQLGADEVAVVGARVGVGDARAEAALDRVLDVRGGDLLAGDRRLPL